MSKSTTSTTPEAAPVRRRSSWLKRAGIGLAVCLLALLLAAGGALYWLGTEAGGRFLQNTLISVLHQAGLEARIGALRGPVPSALELDDLELADAEGVWLTLNKARLRLDLSALLSWQIRCSELRVDGLQMLRAPLLPQKAVDEPSEGSILDMTRLPGWLPAIEIETLDVDSVRLSPALLGLSGKEAVSLALHGSAETVGASGGAPAGPAAVRVALRFEAGRASRPDGTRLDVRGQLNLDNAALLDLQAAFDEEPGGLVGALAGLPAGAPLKMRLEGSAPLRDWQGQLSANVADLAHIDSRLRLHEAEGLTALGVDGAIMPGALLPQELRTCLGDAVRVDVEAGMGPGLIRLAHVVLKTKALELYGQSLELAGKAGADPGLSGRAELRIVDPAALSAVASLPFAQASAELELGGTLREPQARLNGWIKALRLGADVTSSQPDLALNLQASLRPGNVLVLEGNVDAQGSTALPKGTDRLSLDLDVQRISDGVLIRRLSAVSSLAGVSASGQWSATAPFPGVQGEVTITVPQLGELCALLGIAGVDAGRLAVSAVLDPCMTPVERPAEGAAHVEGMPLTGAVRVQLTDMRWGEELAALRRLVGSSAELRAQMQGTTPAATDTTGRLKVSELVLQAAGVSAKGNGTLDLGARSRFDAALEGRLATLEALTPAVSGGVTVSARAHGTLTSPEGTLVVTSPLISAGGERWTELNARCEFRSNLANSKTRAEGRVTAGALAQSGPARIEGRWALHDGVVAVSAFKALLAGVDCNGQLDVRLPEAQRNTPSLSGALKASVSDWNALGRVAGPVSAGAAGLDVTFSPDGGRQAIDVTLSLRDLVVGTSLRQSSLSGTARVEDLFGSPSARANMSLGRGGVQGLRDLRWQKGEIQAAWAAGKAEATARLTGRTQLEAALQYQNATLRVERLNLTLAKKRGVALERPLTVTGLGGPAPVVDAALRFSPSGSLTVQGNLGARRDLTARIEGVPLSLAQAFAGNEVPDGMLSVQASLTGAASAPDLDVRLNLDQIHFPDSVYQPVACVLTARLPARAGALLVELQTRGLGGEELKGRASVPVRYGADGPSLDLRGACSGEVSWAGPLDTLWQFVPLADIRVDGQGRLSATLAGTLEKPRPSMTVQLERLSVSELKSGVELSDMTLSFVLPEKGAATVQLRGGDGRKGTLELSGQADMDQPGLPLAIHGAFTNLAPLSRRDLSISLDGKIDVGGTAGAPDVHGTVTVRQGELRLDNLSGGGFTTLDVEVISEDGSASAVQESTRREIGDVRLLVEIPGRFFVRGHGLESEWRGRLDVHGPLNNPAVTGNIEAVRGVISLLGKSFTLAKGVLRFNGEAPPAPLLDVVVRRNTSKIVTEARLSGSATRPRLTLSSQPPMPQDEVVSQMLFGRAPSELSRAEAIQLGAAVASLAGFGSGGGLMDMTRSLLGMDVLRFGSSRVKTARQSAGNPLAGPSASATEGDEDTSSSVIEVGKYVSDDVYIGVQQGIGSNTTEVFVDIELTPNLDLEARTSSEASEVGVNWSWDY